MSRKPDGDTSLTLMMRVQQDPADPEAWDEFVHRYQPMIRAWCLKWGAQDFDADDVAQQVLIKLMSAMKTYRSESTASFRGWLKAVTHNAWIDFVRRPATTQAPDWISSLADSHDALEDLEQRMEQAYERELLELAMRRIEKRQTEHLGSLPAHIDRKPVRRRGCRASRHPDLERLRRQAQGAETAGGGSAEAERRARLRAGKMVKRLS